MKLVFFGTPEFAVPSLQRLLAEPDLSVVAVVTQPDRRRGRGKQVSPSPVKVVALEAGCPIWQPERIKKDGEVLAQLRDTQADAFIVVAYGQILSPEILAMPRLGCINAHGSLLPEYRGAAPIQWSLYHGKTETGVTTMLMDAGMDTGPMLLKASIPIGLLDTTVTLANTLSHLSAELLLTTLTQLAAGTLTPMPQDPAIATSAPLIQKADYELDWNRSAIALHNQVRGFYPNCITTFRGLPLKVIATLPLGDTYWPQLPKDLAQDLKPAWESLDPLPSAPNGGVIAILKNWGPVIATADQPLLLREVQPSGKRSQSGWDFANGSRLEVGERIGE